MDEWAVFPFSPRCLRDRVPLPAHLFVSAMSSHARKPHTHTTPAQARRVFRGRELRAHNRTTSRVRSCRSSSMAVQLSKRERNLRACILVRGGACSTRRNGRNKHTGKQRMPRLSRVPRASLGYSVCEICVCTALVACHRRRESAVVTRVVRPHSPGWSSVRYCSSCCCSCCCCW